MRVRTALIQQVGSLAKMTEGRQVPPRSPAPPCRQGRLDFLSSGSSFEASTEQISILTGQAQSCINFGALSIGSVGTTITGAFS